MLVSVVPFTDARRRRSAGRSHRIAIGSQYVAQQTRQTL